MPDHTHPAVQQLRLLAIRRLADEHVGSDQLIQAGLEALLADVDTPALRRLAGLTRREEPEAADLFAQVLDELNLGPTLPATRTAAQWELVRGWAQSIVDGVLDPAAGGELIMYKGWVELDHPEALKPIAQYTLAYHDLPGDQTASRADLTARIIEEAHHLLHQPWPPTA